MLLHCGVVPSSTGGCADDGIDEPCHNASHEINLRGEIFAGKWAQGYPQENDVCNAGDGEVEENASSGIKGNGHSHADSDAASISGALIPEQG